MSWEDPFLLLRIQSLGRRTVRQAWAAPSTASSPVTGIRTVTRDLLKAYACEHQTAPAPVRRTEAVSVRSGGGDCIEGR